MARAGQHADRTESKLVIDCKDILDDCTADEASVIQMLAANRVAAIHGFADDPATRLKERKANLVLVLCQANLRLRKQGRLLRTISDYTSVCLPDEPSYKAFHSIFGSWAKALAAAGLTGVAYPEAHLVIREGRPPNNLRRKLDRTDHIKAHAQCIEHHRGLRVSTDQYKAYQLAFGRSLSTYNQIIGVGEGGQKRGWEEATEAAVTWILAHPEDYPQASGPLRRARAATSSKAGRA